MRRFAIMLLSVTALAATTELAAARDGCGSGRYLSGHRCVTIGVNYNGPRAYRDYNRSYGYDRNLRNGCPRNYTIQDGVCKPYRGY
jgi:hypothetical protein